MPTALVTGATSGIGRAYAQRLHDDGWQLVLVARDADALAKIAAELGGAEVLVADLSEPAHVTDVARRVQDPERPVELLVNNAGYGLGSTYLDADPAVENAMFEVNAHAVLTLTRAAL